MVAKVLQCSWMWAFVCSTRVPWVLSQTFSKGSFKCRRPFHHTRQPIQVTCLRSRQNAAQMLPLWLLTLAAAQQTWGRLKINSSEDRERFWNLNAMPSQKLWLESEQTYPPVAHRIKKDKKQELLAVGLGMKMGRKHTMLWQPLKLFAYSQITSLVRRAALKQNENNFNYEKAHNFKVRLFLFYRLLSLNCWMRWQLPFVISKSLLRFDLKPCKFASTATSVFFLIIQWEAELYLKTKHIWDFKHVCAALNNLHF